MVDFEKNKITIAKTAYNLHYFTLTKKEKLNRNNSATTAKYPQVGDFSFVDGKLVI